MPTPRVQEVKRRPGVSVHTARSGPSHWKGPPPRPLSLLNGNVTPLKSQAEYEPPPPRFYLHYIPPPGT
jgi:hypothetical protein